MQQLDWYQIAYLDAAVVNVLAGGSSEPFWQQAYTWVIRWLKVAVDLNGADEPHLRWIATLVADESRLAALVQHTVEICGRRPEPSPSVDLPGVTRRLVRGRVVDDRPARIASNMADWHAREWSVLDPPLRRSIVLGLQMAARSDVTISRREGVSGRRPLPIGCRSGSWALWDIGTLPVSVRDALRRAVVELCSLSSRPEEFASFFEPGSSRVQPSDPTGGEPPVRSGPLAGQVVSFLDQLMVFRSEAVRLAVQAGARCRPALASKVTLLVLGERPDRDGVLQGVARRQAAGQRLEVIDETEFRARLAAPAGLPASEDPAGG